MLAGSFILTPEQLPIRLTAKADKFSENGIRRDASVISNFPQRQKEFINPFCPYVRILACWIVAI